MKYTYLLAAGLVAFFFTLSCQKRSSVSPVYSYDFAYGGQLFTYNKVTFSATAPPGSKYLWSFGDGTFSKDSLPVHVYSAPGKYNVSLSVNGDTLHATQEAISIASTAMKMNGSYEQFEYASIATLYNWPISHAGLYYRNAVFLPPPKYSVDVIDEDSLMLTTIIKDTTHMKFLFIDSYVTDSTITFMHANKNYIVYNFIDNVLYIDYVIIPSGVGYSWDSYRFKK